MARKVTEEKWECLVEKVNKEKREKLDQRVLLVWLDLKESQDPLDPWV